MVYLRILTKDSLILAVLFFLNSCMSSPNIYHDAPLVNQAKLPKPDVEVSVPGLTECTDSDKKIININSNEPISVLVHGCYSSAGRFRALADVFAFHGQQTVCFNYNDRDSLELSADKLTTALNSLQKIVNDKKIQVIGHSQGGLIARRALSRAKKGVAAFPNANIDLTTISTPFSGIEAASHCGSTALAVLSLGITKLICQAVTGSKYKEITANSDFVQTPGKLIASVRRHLRISTDERDTCRRQDENGACLEDDFVFSLEEQINMNVDSDEVVQPVYVKAGHVEIVGDEKKIPYKLISILQDNGVIFKRPKEEPALIKLLEELYLAAL